MNASNFPWVILVPRIPNISELFHLDTKERLDFQMEVDFLLEGMSKVYEAHKMNTASLGNLVPQLHTHIIARFKDDDAWPNPVWSHQNMIKYQDTQSSFEIDKIRKLVDDYA